MIKSSGTISNAKEIIKSLLEKDVLVTVNLGRNKSVSYQGKLGGVYNALFTVIPNTAFSGKTSYSYSEYLCGKVKIKEKST